MGGSGGGRGKQNMFTYCKYTFQGQRVVLFKRRKFGVSVDTQMRWKSSPQTTPKEVSFIHGVYSHQYQIYQIASPCKDEMGIFHIAREDARHQLPGRGDVVRRLPDKKQITSHLH